jgi:LuxR family maltose regulon positive regulatory protein
MRQRDPHLLLALAWMHLLAGQRDASAEAIAAAEKLRPFEPGPMPDGFSSVEADLATLQGMITWGNLHYSVERGKHAAELEGPTSPWLPVIAVGIGWCLLPLGEYLEAERWFVIATEPAVAMEQWRVAVSSLVGRSLVADALHQTDEQTVLVERAVAILREHDLEGVDAELPTAVGAAHEARGDLDAAVASYEQAAQAYSHGGQPALEAMALVRLARILRALGRDAEADRVAADLRRAVDRCPDPGLLRARLNELERPGRAREGEPDGAISERELVVLRALAGPMSEREIARELYLSHNTVHSHARAIYRKLGVSSRADAVTRARDLGLL